MPPATLIDSTQLKLIINRLCYQLIENHDNFENTVILGLQPRGIHLAELIQQRLQEILPGVIVRCGRLDTTFHRDDFRRRDEPLSPNSTQVNFIIEGQKVILVDDVLYTGRTIRSGLDAMLSFGRPSIVELLVLVERRFTRELPVEPKYVGKSVDSYDNQLVKVIIGEGNKDQVLLLTSDKE